MSVYYSPELVRTLMAERLAEARDERRIDREPHHHNFGVRLLTDFARRTTGMRTSTSTCACS